MLFSTGPQVRRWVLWGLLVVLVLSMLSTLVWLAGRYEVSQVQARLERDAADAVSDLQPLVGQHVTRSIKNFHVWLHFWTRSRNNFRFAVAIKVGRGDADPVFKQFGICIKLNLLFAFNVENFYLRPAAWARHGDNFVDPITINVASRDVEPAALAAELRACVNDPVVQSFALCPTSGVRLCSFLPLLPRPPQAATPLPR